MKMFWKTSLIVIALISPVIAGVVFEDQFTKDGDLTRWRVDPMAEVAVEEGMMRLSASREAGDGNGVETRLSSKAEFVGRGIYTLAFAIQTDIRDLEARGNVRIGMPGGMEIRWSDWNNPGRLYHLGEEIGVVDNGARGRMVRFRLVQNGRAVEVFKNDDSIYKGVLPSNPDYKNHGRIALFTKYPVASPTVLENVSLTFEPWESLSEEKKDEALSHQGPYQHVWDLENVPSLHTVSLTISGRFAPGTVEAAEVEVGMLDEGRWSSSLEVDAEGRFGATLKASDFRIIKPGNTETPLVLAYVHQLRIRESGGGARLARDVKVEWVEDRRTAYPWEVDPEPAAVEEDGQVYWPGLHRNNGGHFAWRYEPNGLLIDNVAFGYLDREYYHGGGFRFSFGIPGAVAPELKAVAIEDEGLAITGLENRVDYVADQGRYGEDEVEADWTSFRWVRRIETRDGGRYRQELRYSTLAIGVQVETDAPAFAFSFGREERAGRPTAVLVPSPEGPILLEAEDDLDLAARMEGDWLLLFSGDPRGEAPILVVFERRPDRVAWEGSDLVARRADGVGSLAIGSPFGAPWRPRNLASAWRAAPGDIPLAHLDAAANLLTAYPWTCEETFAVDGDEVLIRNRFTHLPWKSEWGRIPKPRAPLPPLIAYSIMEGYLPEETVGGMEDADIPTKWGPLWTKPGTELAYRLPVPRAWDWFPLATEPGTPVEEAVHRGLTDRSFTPEAMKRLLRPVVEPPKHPHYVAQDFTASAWRAMAYMPPERREDFTALAAARVWHALFPQSYRLRTDPVSGAQYRASTFVWNHPDRVNGEGFADVDYWQGLTLYGLYTHAKYSGDWDLMERNWPTIRSMFSYWEALNSWALMAPGAREAGEMYHADMGTAGYAGLVGFHRLAERLGTPYQRDLGAYLLAKNAVPSTAKFGFGKWVARLSHREYVAGRSSSGFGERWIASFPGVAPDRSNFSSGDVWWLTGCVGPLSVQIEALDLWLERAPDDAEQFQRDLRAQISDEELLRHDSRRVIPHLMMRDFLGGEWRDNAADLYDRYSQTYLLRDAHAPASLLSRDAKAWLLDWTPGVLGEAGWSREAGRAVATLRAPEPTLLRWAVRSAPVRIQVNGVETSGALGPDTHGWRRLDVALGAGEHRVELTW